MSKRLALFIGGAILAVSLEGLPRLASSRPPAGQTLPARLDDQTFWKMISDFSEPGGTFRSDNLLSNEARFQYIVPDLTRKAKPGRVYLGVGPEQNFTYLTALKPAMVFVFDIRRGNLDLHLMYKALLELSADRAEFVSRLFSRRRPEGLGVESPAADIFAVYEAVEPSETLYHENLDAIEHLLLVQHRLELTDEDLRGIQHVYNAFFTYGPGIRYSSSGGFGGSFQPSYADLMTATDATGRAHGYLATEDSFRFLKDLQTRNLLVPVVGNFAGPKAIRAVAAYLKEHSALVSAFYLSNVEQFLRQDGIWSDFCANAATLPVDESSTFIRATRRGGYSRGFGLSSELAAMEPILNDCASAY